MRVMIDMAHPGHVHFFRHAISELQARGDEVLVTALPKEITLDLLHGFGIAHEVVSSRALPPLLRPLKVADRDLKLVKLGLGFKPDVVTAIGGVWAAHAAFLLRKPAVVWDDTEHHKWGHRATWPFASAIYSPDCYSLPKAHKQTLYAGTHDLAYLAPQYFAPDAEIVRGLGIDPDKPFCIVRLVSWQAVHDIGHSGFSAQKLLSFLQALERHARPLITSEKPLAPELEPYQLKIPPHQIHHVMAFARLCVGEGGTMATEAAVLGTPAVLVTTLQAGVFEEFKRHGLLQQTADTDEALRLCLGYLEDSESKARAREQRDAYLSSRVDVTQLIVDTLRLYAARGR
jgi:predicted glycosyltransferase